MRADLLRRDDVRLHTVGAVQQGLVLFDLERIGGVAGSSSPCVEYWTLKSSSWLSVRQIPEARLVQGTFSGVLVVRADDLRVPSRRAGADSSRPRDRDVADPVTRREVVRRATARSRRPR